MFISYKMGERIMLKLSKSIKFSQLPNDNRL
jgi:hypothetical protein